LKPIRMLRSAQNDIRSESAFYRKISPELAGRFYAAVKVAVRAIPDMPLAMQELDYGIRRWPVDHGFLHGVLYKVEPTEILVLCVFHPSQDPERWRSRART
jgi:plasmid stabilization system protein ParE